MSQDSINDEFNYAAGEGDLQRVKALVQQGAALNVFDQDMNWTPLHYACKKGHIEVARFLDRVWGGCECT